jgi:predicted membrane protein
MKKKHILATIGALTVATTATAVAYSVNSVARKMKPYDKKFKFTGEKKVYDGEFDTDSLAVTFGGLAIDMKKATLKDNLGTLKLFGHFSGIDIVVPDDWAVKTIGTNKNSGISNLAEEETTGDQPTLIVKHDVHYCGLSVRRASSTKNLKMDIQDAAEEVVDEAKEVLKEVKEDLS